MREIESDRQRGERDTRQDDREREIKREKEGREK